MNEPSSSSRQTLLPDYTHFVPSDVPQHDFHVDWVDRRRESPVSYSSEHGGFYFVTRYDDVHSVLCDTDTFSNKDSASIPKQPFFSIPEDLDPPEHRKFRRLALSALSPQRVADYEPAIRQDVKDLLNGLINKTEFDLVEDFAAPFTRSVALKLIGVPLVELPRIAEWTELLIFTPRDSPEAKRAGVELFAYLRQFVDERINSPEQDDLVGVLLRGEVDGRPLTPDELMAYVVILLLGGLHTTTHAIAGALVWLADHPEDRARLREEPALYRSAVEEALRFTSPSTHLARTVVKDTTVGGCPIPAGSRVLVGIGSANQDESVSTNPEILQLDRSPNPHAAFGFGPHRCLGSHLAKLELRVAIEEFLTYFADFVVRDHAALRYEGAEVRGLVTVPVKITS